MKKYKKNHVAGIVLMLLLAFFVSQTKVLGQRKNKSKERVSAVTTGKQDRDYWSQLLYKNGHKDYVTGAYSETGAFRKHLFS